jgi:hypothetical protein
MKLKLEFDLPEETEEFETWYKGGDYRLCLGEFSDWMRSKLKHGDGFKDTEAQEALWRILNENGVEL